MKKTLLSIACCLLTLFIFTTKTPSQAEAALQAPSSQVVSDYIETLEGGSYFRVTVLEDVSPSFSRSTQTKSGSKYVTFYDADDNALWTFTVYGTFEYTPGANAACISSSYSVNIYDDSWENTLATSSTNGNQAVGDATFIKKVLFITTHKENVRLVLSCNAYGTLS